MITKNASDILHKIAGNCPTCGKAGYQGLGAPAPGQQAPPAQQPPAAGRPKWFEDWLKERDQQKQAPQTNERNAPTGAEAGLPGTDFDEFRKPLPWYARPRAARIRDVQAGNQTLERRIPRWFRQGMINQPL